MHGAPAPSAAAIARSSFSALLCWRTPRSRVFVAVASGLAASCLAWVALSSRGPVKSFPQSSISYSINLSSPPSCINLNWLQSNLNRLLSTVVMFSRAIRQSSRRVAAISASSRIASVSPSQLPAIAPAAASTIACNPNTRLPMPLALHWSSSDDGMRPAARCVEMAMGDGSSPQPSRAKPSSQHPY